MNPSCGTNPALKGVRDAVSGIGDLLKSGKAGLAALQSKIGGLEKSIASAITPKTSGDSFVSELAGLIGGGEKAAAAFLAKWGGKVQDADKWVAKVLSDPFSINFCQDVPNVKMDPATQQVVQEPPETVPPSSPPAAVAPLQPTVVDNSQKKVDPPAPALTATVAPEAVRTYRDKFLTQYKTQVEDPLQAISKKKSEEVARITALPGWISASQKSNFVPGSTEESLLREGKLNDAEADAVSQYVSAKRDLLGANQAISVCSKYLSDYSKAITDKYLGMADSAVLGDDYLDSLTVKSLGYGDYIRKVRDLIEANRQVVIDYTKYMTAQFQK